MAPEQGLKQNLIAPDQQSGNAAPEPTCRQKMIKYVGGGCLAGLVVLYILAWMLQGLLYLLATTANGCRAGSLENYNYASAGGVNSTNHDAAYNVLPKITYLTEKDHTFYGQSFTVLPTNDAGVLSSPVGTWWMAWGPVYNTYIYTDVLNSETTLYMRRNLLRIGQSHRVAKCDGSGPDIQFEEGLNYFGNRVRYLFGMTQSFSYKIFMDKKDGKGRQYVATAEEANTGYSSITFVNRTGSSEQIADTVLQARNFHGKFDQWLVKNHNDNDLPFYVISAASLLYAFHELGIEKTKDAANQGGTPKFMLTFPDKPSTVFEQPPKVETHV